MKKIFDKETKNFAFLIIFLTIFTVFLLPRINSTGFLKNGSLTDVAKPVIEAGTNGNQQVDVKKVEIDKSKQYIATVATSVGSFDITLFASDAPKNVGNFVSNAGAKIYDKADIAVRSDLFKIDSKKEPKATTEDEINADFLLLDRTKVKNVEFLKAMYNKDDATTKSFSPENLAKYEDYSLKDFYTYELKYTYAKDIQTQSAKKYIVMMATDKPNQNKSDFFIVLASTLPQADGLYTPIGQVTQGFDVVDSKIANSTVKIKVESINVQSK